MKKILASLITFTAIASALFISLEIFYKKAIKDM